jgi:hypothetical protein
MHNASAQSRNAHSSSISGGLSAPGGHLSSREGDGRQDDYPRRHFMSFQMLSTFPAMLALAIVASPAAAAGPPSNPAEATTPIRPLGECLKRDQVLDWGVIDQRHLVVKALGKRYYDIQLAHDCPDLLKRPYFSFREGFERQPDPAHRTRTDIGTDPVTHDGRICGDMGDAVVPHSAIRSNIDIPCRIGSIRRIDEITYERVFEQADGPEHNRQPVDHRGSLVEAQAAVD